MAQEEEPRLIRIDGEERKVFPIPAGTTRIGRSPRNEICLQDTAVSRFHCYLIRDGNTVLAFNDRSKNPARVDGEVAAARRLKSGEVLEIGRCRLVYHGPLTLLPAKVPSRRPRIRRGLRSLLSPPVPPKGAVRRPSRAPAPVLALLAVSFLVLAPAVAWVFIAAFGGAVKDGSPPPGAAESAVAAAPQLPAAAGLPPAPGPAGPASREAELAPEIRKLLAEYREELRSENARKAEALAARVAELEAELARVRSNGGDSAPAGGKVVPATLEGPRAGTFPVGAVEASDPAAAGSPSRSESDPAAGKTTAASPPGISTPAARTVVPPSVPGAKLSLREIGDLVETLCRRIDEYATLTVTPSSLEPELGKLATAPGKAASEGVLRVDDHLRRLLRSTRAASEENRRRKEALLARSREDERSGKPPAGSESKKEGEYGSRPVGDGVERDQRLLELSEKAMKIQEKQTQSLLRLRETVLSALGRKSDPESVAYLRFSFTYESDADLCRAILPVFQSAGSRDCIPTLYHKLSGARDPALKEAIHRTLIHLAGRDLGDTTGPWAEWWVREGKKELER